jgi:hypothetical protein
MDKTFAADQKFKIVIKRDFGSGPGYLINGKWVKSGFVVTRGGCNIMPGATWFQTVEAAMKGIAAYISSETSDEFWARVRA